MVVLLRIINCTERSILNIFLSFKHWEVGINGIVLVIQLLYINHVLFYIDEYCIFTECHTDCSEMHRCCSY